MRPTQNHYSHQGVTSPDPFLRQPFRQHPRRLTFPEECVVTSDEARRDDIVSRNQFQIADHAGIIASTKASPWVKSTYHHVTAPGKYDFISPSKSPGWQSFTNSITKRGNRGAFMAHQGDQHLKALQKYFIPIYGPQQFYALDGGPINEQQQHGHHVVDQRLRIEATTRSRSNFHQQQQYLISPMCKYGGLNASEPHIYGDTLGEGLLTGTHKRAAMHSVSPHKILMHLGAGQAPLGTPLRSPGDSQESRLGVFASLKCEDSLMPSKADPQF